MSRLEEATINRLYAIILDESKESTVPVDPVQFANACIFFNEQFGDAIPLQALISENKDTELEYKNERRYFKHFIMHSCQDGKFSKPEARAYFILYPFITEPKSLTSVYNVSSNQTLAQKYKAGTLHGHEWLTDADINSFLQSLTLTPAQHISVLRLDPKSVGMALHLARRHAPNNKATGDAEPYAIPMILNLSASTSSRSQGSHWVNVIFEVNPTTSPTQVTATLVDSDNMPEGQQKKIAERLKEAIAYEEVIPAQPNAIVYQAFPRADVTINIDCKNEQTDSWSCGYHALHSLLSKLKYPNTETLTQLQDIKDIQHAITAATIQSAKVEIDEAVLGESLHRHSSSSRKVTTVTAEHAKAQQQRLKLRATYRDPVIRLLEAHYQREENYVTLKTSDILAIYQDKGEPHTDAVIAIVVDWLNSKKVTELKFTDGTQDSTFYDNDNWNACYSVTQVSGDHTKPLAAIAERNQLFAESGMTGLDAEDDLWMQYWHKVLREVSSTTNTLAPLAIHNIKAASEDIYNQYLLKMLKYIDSTSAIYKSGDKQFPFPTLSLIDNSIDENYFKKSLDILINFLKDGGVSLFTTIELAVPAGCAQTKAHTTKIIELIDLLDKMPNRNNSTLEFVASGEGAPSREFCDILLDHVEKKKTCVMVKLTSPNFDKIYTSTELFSYDTPAAVARHIQNIIIRQRRAQVKIEPAPEKDPSLKTGTTGYSREYSSQAQIRAVKTQALQVSVSTQSQTQTQAQTQQSAAHTAVEFDSDSEETNYFSSVKGGRLIDKAAYLANQEYSAIANHIMAQFQHTVGHDITANLLRQINELKINAVKREALAQEIENKYEGVEQNEWSDTDKNNHETHMILMKAIANAIKDLEERISTLSPEHENFANLIFSQSPSSKGIHYLTADSIAMIHQFPFLFRDGIDTKNLPLGFSVKPVEPDQYQQSGLVLCYDATIEADEQFGNPLTVKCNQQSYSLYWDGDLRSFKPQNTQFSSEQERNQTINSCYGTKDPTTGRLCSASLDCESRVKTLLSSLELEVINKYNQQTPDSKNDLKLLDSYTWAFNTSKENKPAAFKGENYTALMDVMYHQGYQAAMRLMAALDSLYQADPELYINFKATFLDHRKSFVYLLEEDNLAAIEKLCKFKSHGMKRQWWISLSSQHMSALQCIEASGVDQVDVNINDLIKGIDYFFDKTKGLSLPPCPITDCQNMLVSLSRFQYVLSKVHPDNLQDQLDNLTGLDWSKDGAVLAAAEGAHFFHYRMKYTYSDEAEKVSTLIHDGLGCSVQVLNEKDFITLNRYDIEDRPRYVLFLRYFSSQLKAQSTVVFLDKIFNSILRNFDHLKQKHHYGDILSLSLIAAVHTKLTCETQLDDFADLLIRLESINSELFGKVLGVLCTWIQSGFKLLPNSNAMSGLIQLLMLDCIANEYEEIPDDNTELFNKHLSKSALNAYAKFAQHNLPVDTPDKLQTSMTNAKHYLAILRLISKQDPQHFDLLANTFAVTDMKDFDSVVSLLDNLLSIKGGETVNQYDLILSTLASIDQDQNPAIDPQRISTLLMISDKRNINAEICHELAEFKFELDSVTLVTQTNFTAEGAKEIEKANDTIGGILGDDHKIDITKLQAAHGSDYLTTILANIKKAGINKVTVIGWAGLEKRVTKTINALMLSVTLGQVNQCKDRFSATQKVPLDLLIDTLLNDPKEAGSYDDVPNYYNRLKEHSAVLLPLLNKLSALNSQWQDNLPLRQILTSSIIVAFDKKAGQDNILQLLNPLLDCFYEMQLEALPTELFNLIFSDNAKLKLTEDLIEKAIKPILLHDALSLSQKAQLMEHINEPNFIESTQCRLSICSKIVNSPDFISMFAIIVKLDGNNLVNYENFITKYKDYPDEQIAILNAMLSQNESEPEVDAPGLLQTLNNFEGEDLALIRVIRHSCLPEWQSAITGETIRLLNSLDDEKKDALIKLYKEPPYPKSQTVLQILCRGNVNEFTNYELDPFGYRANPEVVQRQFNMDSAAARIGQLQDISRDNQLFFATHQQELLDDMTYINAVGHDLPLFIPFLADSTDSKLLEGCKKPVKDLTRAELVDFIKHCGQHCHKDSPEGRITKLELLAALRESIYRTSGKFPYATQMIAELSMLLNKGNTFVEIRTGEGKTLMTALQAAYRWASGESPTFVDVCCSHAVWADRDYREFQDFFEFCNIPTTLVNDDFKASSYYEGREETGGVTYGSISGMSLVHQQLALDVAQQPSHRVAIIDEVDANIFDESTSTFQIAEVLEQDVDTRLYPYLLAFVDEWGLMDTRYQDIDQFYIYINSNSDIKNNKTRTQLLTEIICKRESVDRLLDSAKAAKQLAEDTNFTVRPILRADGTPVIDTATKKPLMQAVVKLNHEERPGSTYDRGVHQFLHLRLNKEYDRYTFPPLDETTYLSSQSVKDFLAEYDNLVGLTGTLGSDEEVAEIKRDYAAVCLRIPPHKLLRRVDHLPEITKKPWYVRRDDPRQRHYKAILKRALQERKKGKSVLILCDSVAESDALHKFMQGKYPDLRLYNGKDGKLEDAIEAAGRRNRCTIGTPLLGRAADIKPEGGDLSVIKTYISTGREHGQGVGRGGRQGQVGDSYTILRDIPSTAAIAATQAEKERALAKTRCERNLLADVKSHYIGAKNKICKLIKNDLIKQAASTRQDYRSKWNNIQSQIHRNWGKFLIRIDDLWAERYDALAKNKDAQSPEEFRADVKNQLGALEKLIHQDWESFIGQVNQLVDDSVAADDTTTLKAMIKEAAEPSTGTPKAKSVMAPNLNVTQPLALHHPYQKPVDLVYAELAGSENVNLLRQSLKRIDDSLAPYSRGKALIDEPINEISEDKVIKTFEEIVSYLLTQYYLHQLGNTKNLIPIQLVVSLYQEIITLVSQSSDDSDRLQSLYRLHKTHFTKNANELLVNRGHCGTYLHHMSEVLRSLDKQIQERAPQLGESEDRNKNLEQNEEEDIAQNTIDPKNLLRYALSQLKRYDSDTFFSKNSSRRRTLKALMSKLKSNETNITSESILEYIDEASNEARVADQAHDATRRSSGFRNLHGSRFQNTLEDIRRAVFACLDPKDEQKNLLLKKEMQRLGASITGLIDRATTKAFNDSSIRDINQKNILSDLITKLNELLKDEPVSAEQLVKAYQQLMQANILLEDLDKKHGHWHVRQPEGEHAYFNLLKATRKQLLRFKATFDRLCPADAYPDKKIKDVETTLQTALTRQARRTAKTKNPYALDLSGVMKGSDDVELLTKLQLFECTCALRHFYADTHSQFDILIDGESVKMTMLDPSKGLEVGVKRTFRFRLGGEQNLLVSDLTVEEAGKPSLTEGPSMFASSSKNSGQPNDNTSQPAPKPGNSGGDG